ncbi:membrane protein [Streptomyces viridochromogenes]|uniref:Membrane protein n=2 Tax=Streptomyces viridochromogenes TaxID=1938 RepID=A0A0J8BVL1_STRVR|nr:membrane protein [Streptomyces viridochromogenes]KOG14244.1 membrane protein [Streptomyces viridochromogenes]KOG15557.1 membrane protein [Streptomyces viridochromogenes]
MGRLVGLDLARALAVFGMYIVHIAPMPSAGDNVGSWVYFLAEGRSSALFATLAGFSLMLIAGRREPKTGLAGRQAKARIAIRAVILLALGTVLAMEYGDIIILAYYGVYFLLALLLVRLSAKTLAIIAAGIALVMPQLAFVLKMWLSDSVQQSINAYDPLEKLSTVGVLDLLLTGLYPTITWLAFVIAGMALARLDLTAASVQRRLAALGAGLTVGAYGLAMLLGGTSAVLSFRGGGGPSSGSGAGSMGSGPGAGSMGSGSGGPVQSASDLLGAVSHTGTTFDTIGCLGVAILVIVGATVAIDRLPRLRRLAKPVIAVGTMSLTAYVGHFLAQSAWPASGAGTTKSWVPVITYVLGAIVFAAIWSRFFRRGPLEYLLNAATKPAKYIR